MEIFESIIDRRIRIKPNWLFQTGLIIFNLIMCVFSGNKYVNYISLLSFVAFMISYFKTSLITLIKYFPIVVNLSLAILAVFLIEYTLPHLPELGKASAFYGALPLYVEYYSIFLLSLSVFDYNSQRRKRLTPVNFKWENNTLTKELLHVASLFFLAMVTVMFARIATKPYFFLKVDRFQYRSIYITGIWLKLEKYMIYGIPVLMMNWRNGKRKYTSAAALVIFFLYYLWQGEKYSAYMGVLLFVLMYAMSENKNIKQLQKIVPKLVALVGILVGIIIAQYSLLYRGAAINTLSKRIAQQGQLWWATYGEPKAQGLHLSEIINELLARTNSQGIPSNYGIYKIMYLNAPSTMVTNKILSGATYTESTPASLFYYLGPVGMLCFAVIFGWLFAKLTTFYVHSIHENCIIEALLITKIISDCRYMFAMSGFSVFLSIDNLVKWGIILACVIARKRLKISKVYQTIKPEFS